MKNIVAVIGEGGNKRNKASRNMIRKGYSLLLSEKCAAGIAKRALLGHVQIQLAIIFGKIKWKFFDYANIAVKIGSDKVFRPVWRKVFKSEAVKETVQRILYAE